MQTKECNKCNIAKNIDCFSKDKKAKDGLSYSCKSCLKLYHAEYFSKNKLKLIASNKAWAISNKEKNTHYKTKWRENNRDKIKSSTALTADGNRKRASRWAQENKQRVKLNLAAWLLVNPEAKRIYEHNRKARKESNGGRLSKGLAKKLFTLQRGLCPCCNQPLGDSYHMDHIMPLALGGANEDWNMQLLTQRCNNQKCAKHPIEFMQERGFLI